MRLSFKTEDQKKPDYLKINPEGARPCARHRPGLITETLTLLLYVAQMFPAARLAPLDARLSVALAKVQEFNSYLCSTVHVAHAHRMRGYRWVEADDAHAIAAMQKKVPQSVGDGFRLIENEMLKGPWVMGEAYIGLRRLPVHAGAILAVTASTSARCRRSRSTSSAPASGRPCARLSRTRRGDSRGEL